ncbi:MAG: ABC transporter permease [Acidobacteria bacterium]|nr:ABC transporter permease [Acidobacteriota bacterium]MCC6990701.1 ABC transporter permease [Acidobacteriota bacterium]
MARLLPVLVAISVLVFSIVHMIPGDPAVIAAGLEASPATVEAIRRDLGLDRPLGVQYGRFVTRALQGDFGTSVRTGAPVGREILDRLPHTMILAAGGVALAVLLGLLVGTASALSRHVFVDRLLTAASLIAASTPSYWLALMLMLLFSLALGWLPAIGVGTPLHYVLPCLALGLQSAGAVARMTRASVLEVLTQDFLRAARAKGLPFRRVLLAHGLRNALLPVLSLVGLRIGGLLAGTVLVESVFAVPGVGRMMADAVVARDFPMVQGGVLVVAAMVVAVNGLTDVVAGLLDPRVRA